MHCKSEHDMSTIQNAYNVLTQAQPQVAQTQAQAQTVDQSIVQEVQNVIGEMFRIANEIAFELVTTDCQAAREGKCQIAIKCRELITQLKRLVEIQRRARA